MTDQIPDQLRRAASQIENRTTYIAYLEHNNTVMRELLQEVWKDASVVMTVGWQQTLHDELAGPEKWGQG